MASNYPIITHELFRITAARAADLDVSRDESFELVEPRHAPTTLSPGRCPENIIRQDAAAAAVVVNGPQLAGEHDVPRSMQDLILGR